MKIVIYCLILVMFIACQQSNEPNDFDYFNSVELDMIEDYKNFLLEAPDGFLSFNTSKINEYGIPNVSLLDSYDIESNISVTGCYKTVTGNDSRPPQWVVNSRVRTYESKSEKHEKLNINSQFELQFKVVEGNGSLDVYNVENASSNELQISFQVYAEKKSTVPNVGIVRIDDSQSRCKDYYVDSVTEMYLYEVLYTYRSNDVSMLNSLKLAASGKIKWAEASVRIEKVLEEYQSTITIDTDVNVIGAGLQSQIKEQGREIIAPLLTFSIDPNLNVDKIQEDAEKWLKSLLDDNSNIRGKVTSFSSVSFGGSDNAANNDFSPDLKKLWDYSSQLKHAASIISSVSKASNELPDSVATFRIDDITDEILKIVYKDSLEFYENLSYQEKLESMNYVLSKHNDVIHRLKNQGWKTWDKTVNDYGDDLTAYLDFTLPGWSKPRIDKITSGILDYDVRRKMNIFINNLSFDNYMQLTNNFKPDITYYYSDQEFDRDPSTGLLPPSNNYGSRQKYYFKIDPKIEMLTPTNVSYRPVQGFTPDGEPARPILSSDRFKFLLQPIKLQRNLDTSSETFVAKLNIYPRNQDGGQTRRAQYMHSHKGLEIYYEFENYDGFKDTLIVNPSWQDWTSRIWTPPYSY